ncbi:hypothetical protein LINPERHAP2_LOCUS15866 [Linum perenne]
MKHSKVRNAIVCTFGILKLRWALLRDTSWFSPQIVVLIETSCCLLHNFIRKEGGPDAFKQAYVPPRNEERHFVDNLNMEHDISGVEAF